MTHFASRIADGTLENAWVECMQGQGIGQGVTFKFDGEYEVDGFVISAGYQKSRDLYDKNSRPASLVVESDDGTYEVFQLDDTYSAQTITFSEPIIASEISFVIDSVYEGYKYEDTVISELQLF